MVTDEKLRYFLELVHCSYNIYHYEYSPNGVLLDTDCTHDGLIKTLERSGCLAYAQSYEENMPLCLSTLLGMLWGAAFTGEGTERRIHIIGPVLNTELSEKTIEEAARRYLNDPELYASFSALMNGIPIVPFTLFQHYMLMLHYTLTGEMVTPSDINYQKSSNLSEQPAGKEPQRDRHQTYLAEKRLLYHVRTGDLNYTEALKRSSSLSTGVQVKTREPVNQAIISTTTFTSLCTRAAIEGGLSPDMAYSTGDAYIQAMLGCKTISELGQINHNMFEDFIRRVKKVRTDTALSAAVRACCDYIQLHAEDEISISLLAQNCGYTDYYLARKFKKEMNISIGEYTNRIRIEKAKLLLETSDMSIADIAAALRYCSSAYFSETFYRIVGELPSAYRKEKQGR